MDNITLDSQLDKVSYSLGLQIGQGLKTDGLSDLDPQIIAKAIQDVFGDKELLLDEAESKQTVISYMNEKQELKLAENTKAGEAFLAKNKGEEGVVTLDSGLQYKIITEGSGDKPTAADKVTTHYHGTLIDGTVFDSSVDRGEPASFPVGGVIPGWTEALQLMPVGSKWRLFVPSALAYGERGAGGVIGPNTTLIFDVELLSIDK